MSGASKGAREFRGHALTHGWDVIYSPFRREGTLAPGNSLTTGDLVERVTVRNRDTAVRIEQTWIAGRKTAYHAEPLAASRARIAAAPRLAAGGRALAAGGGPGGLAVHGDPGREPGRQPRLALGVACPGRRVDDGEPLLGGTELAEDQ